MERVVQEAVRKAQSARRPAVSGFGAVLFVVGLFTDAIESPWKWVMVGVGVVLVAAGFLWTSRRSAEPTPRPRARMVAALAIGIVVGLAADYAIDWLSERFRGDCDDPVELTVLLPTDGAFGFEDAVSAFNESYTDDSGCRLANVTTYAAPWPEARKALESGWESDSDLDRLDPLYGFEPLLDVGPRPDLWLAESRAQVELVEGPLDASPAGDGVLDSDRAEPIGSTPLVVAIPRTVFETHFGTSDQVVNLEPPDLLERLRDDRALPVVRSDPNLSYTALAFLPSLYGTDSGADSIGTRVENQLARSIEEAGLTLPGTDTDLICDVATSLGADPDVAVLTTERALSRYNSGDPLGPNCPLSADQRSGLAPLYHERLGSLDYQAVRLEWDDPWADERSTVAADLTAWLAGEDDRWWPERIGIRGNDYDGQELDGDVDFAPAFHPSSESVGPGALDALIDAYGEHRVATNVLLSIDGSLSMGTQIDGEGRSRFELAAEGVRAALEYLGPRDGAGLWTFPAEGEAAYVELLEIDTGRGPEDAAVLDGTDYPLVRGVDLHRTLIEGVEALDAYSEGDGVEAMVVLTDGADRDNSGISAAEVIERVAASEVSLYVIAVGDASCRSNHFSDMTEHSRIDCLEAEEDQIKSTFDRLFRQLWG